MGLEESIQVEETSAAKAWGMEDLSLGNKGGGGRRNSLEGMGATEITLFGLLVQGKS